MLVTESAVPSSRLVEAFHEAGEWTCTACGGGVRLVGDEVRVFECADCGRESDGCQTFEGHHLLYGACPLDEEGVGRCGNWRGDWLRARGACPVCGRVRGLGGFVRRVEVPNRYRRRPSFASAWQVRRLRITTDIPDLSGEEWAACEHAALVIHRANEEPGIVRGERLLRVARVELGEFEVRVTSEEEIKAEVRAALEEVANAGVREVTGSAPPSSSRSGNPSPARS